MLSQLYIENIAVIEKTSIDFGPGLNVLTGETGAGKSIVIDSINAILGERTSRELVRTGARSAFVSAVFTDSGASVMAALRELGYEPEEDGILIQREIKADGKTVCRVNGRPATVSVLKALGAHLISIHGQHDSYDLLSPEVHIRYIDRLGVPEELQARYRAAYTHMCALQKELAAQNMDEAEKARRMDLLAYQIEELEAAQLRTGEQEELNELHSLYSNSERIAQSLSRAADAMDGDESFVGAVSAVADAAAALQDAARFLPGLQELAQRVQGVQYELEDCRSEVSGFAGQLQYDPEELERVEERLDLLYRLGLKYGSSVEEMQAYLEKCQEELQGIALSEETLQRLTAEHKEAKALAEQLAGELSALRQKTARVFARRVKEELAFLDMPNIDFSVQRESCALGPGGCDKMQFFISTNPGEPAKPIAKIASGGELSRIMLAIKTVLAGRDEIDTLIFDEVDTGVSGSAAQKVGLKLRQAAKNRQVICVTHLAQIAALANRQYRIQKHVSANRTFTDVTALDFDGRKQELARIIGGAQITALTLQNAEEMLRLAENEKVEK